MHLGAGYDSGRNRDLLKILGYSHRIASKGQAGSHPSHQTQACKVLRQTVIGMVAGASLGEHENLGEATVLVLLGRVRLSSSGLSWQARKGDMIFVPDARHSLVALEDSAVLLTVAKLS